MAKTYVRYALLSVMLCFFVWAYYFFEQMSKDDTVKEIGDVYDQEIHKLEDKSRDSLKIEKIEKHVEELKENNIPVAKHFGLDWSDNAYEVIRKIDPNAPGEMGKGYTLKENELTDEQKEKVKEGWKNNGFNQYISDMVSLERRLPDYRWPDCKNKSYMFRTDLPEVSIIIPFRDEAWSTLLRTVHSIMNRTPPQLLKEIILSDDASIMEHLHRPLEDYISQFEKVKVVRLKERGGLIRTRLNGYAISTAPVVVFIDSHCEVTKGWIEPLLDRIATDDRIVATGVMDVIEGTNFKYRPYQIDDTCPVGTFDWRLLFKWTRVKYEDDKTAPVKTPTLIGCLIAISRRFFDEIGRFDEGYFIWGAENLEISFKAWMCGGRVEQMGCSHVGHVYKGRLPYNWGNSSQGKVLDRNLLRLTEVWLDDYGVYHKQLCNGCAADIGDVSERIALRNKLQCHNFEWYLENVKPDMFIPGECFTHGEIRNKQHNSICVDASDEESIFGKLHVSVYGCHGRAGNQLWYLCNYGQIRRLRGCWAQLHKSNITLTICDDNNDVPRNHFEYREDDTIYHADSKKCLDLYVDNKSQILSLLKCTGEDNQKWSWSRGAPPGPIPKYRLRSREKNKDGDNDNENDETN